MTSRNVPSRIFRLADCDNNGHLNVEELMNFLIAVSKPRQVLVLTFPTKAASRSHRSPYRGTFRTLVVFTIVIKA